MAWEAVPIYGPAWVVLYKGSDAGPMLTFDDPSEARQIVAKLNRLATRGPEVLALLAEIQQAAEYGVRRRVADLIAEVEGRA